MKKLDSNSIAILKEFYQEVILQGVEDTDSFDRLTEQEIVDLCNTLCFRRFILSKLAKQINDDLKIEMDKINDHLLVFENKFVNPYTDFSDLRKLINKVNKIWKK